MNRVRQFVAVNQQLDRSSSATKPYAPRFISRETNLQKNLSFTQRPYVIKVFGACAGTLYCLLLGGLKPPASAGSF